MGGAELWCGTYACVSTFSRQYGPQCKVKSRDKSAVLNRTQRMPGARERELLL